MKVETRKQDTLNIFQFAFSFFSLSPFRHLDYCCVHAAKVKRIFKRAQQGKWIVENINTYPSIVDPCVKYIYICKQITNARMLDERKNIKWKFNTIHTYDLLLAIATTTISFARFTQRFRFFLTKIILRHITIVRNKHDTNKNSMQLKWELNSISLVATTSAKNASFIKFNFKIRSRNNILLLLSWTTLPKRPLCLQKSIANPINKHDNDFFSVVCSRCS